MRASRTRQYVVSGFSWTWMTMPCRILACALALTLCQLVTQVDESALLAQPVAMNFVDVTAKAGIEFTHVNGASAQKHIAETMGSGALFFDFDNDGWLDLFLVDGGSVADPAVARQARHRLYRNRGAGQFEDVTDAAGVHHREYGMGACAADYDNDHRVDLYVTNFGPDVLYHNDGHGAFSDVTRSAGVGSNLLGASCAFADIDNDGDVDLFVANYVDPDASKICGDARARAYCRPDVYAGVPSALYRNNGDGTFTDVTKPSGLGRSDGKALGVVFADYDSDGRVDLFVANDLTRNFLYHNEGNGAFKEVGLPAGVAVASDGRVRAGMGTDAGDYDGDGRLDLVVTNFESETHSVFRNLGGGLFADATYESGLGPVTLPFLGFGVAFLDYDNDTDLDLVIANGHVLDNTDLFKSTSKYAQRNLLLRNEGRGRFMEVGRQSGPGFALEKVSRTVVSGDIDNDGDLDLLVSNNGQPPDLLRNDTNGLGNALRVKLRGRQSNRDGIGAVLVATVGAKRLVREVRAGSSYLGQNDVRIHFGMGRAAAADRLEIRWPSGRIDVLKAIASQQDVTVAEGEGAIEFHPLNRR
ncbi:MAG TPA: CRTAC1 family protein [Vicinamibacterales bacterium]|nr:CRTAC1 family protein [Vicinamibacterales bacterium]